MHKFFDSKKIKLACVVIFGKTIFINSNSNSNSNTPEIPFLLRYIFYLAVLVTLAALPGSFFILCSIMNTLFLKDKVVFNLN